jgi:DNA primase
LMKIENMTFPEAVEDLAKRAGVTIERSSAQGKLANERERLLQINGIAASYFSLSLNQSPRATAYLQGRGVSTEAIDKYGIGYAPSEWRGLVGVLTSKRIGSDEAVKAGLLIRKDDGSGYYDRFRDRIIIPIQDVNGRAIAFGGRAFGDELPKYLNSPETPLFVKNRTLYGLNHARRSIAQQDRAVIVEGYLDAITAQCAGFENTVATMGTALTPEHVNLLSRYTHTAIIAFDSDSAGMSATLRSAPMFEQAGFDVKIVCMPNGEDPDSLLRGGQSAVFARLLDEALPVVEYRLRLLTDKADLTTDNGKVEMLKQAAAVLAGVGSAVERDRYVRELAQYHPNFSSGATRAEEDIRRDIEGRLGNAGRKAPVRGNTPSSGGEAAKSPASGLILAERSLIRAIITDPGWGRKVFAELEPRQFATSEGRTLATVIAERLAAGQSVAFDELSEAVAETEAAGLLSELSVADSGPEITEQAVTDCWSALKTHWKGQRMRELAARVERGEMSAQDEEFTEYWRLVQELHNKVQKKN